jgi:hypothetical protein
VTHSPEFVVPHPDRDSSASIPGLVNSSPTAHPVREVRDAWSALELDVLDTAVADAAARTLGHVDPAVGERIVVERLSLQDAALTPLTRQGDPRGQDEHALSVISTFVLPSGRVLQMRRRFPGVDELHRQLAADASPPPALWIREILVGRLRGPALVARLPWIEAATVIDDSA